MKTIQIEYTSAKANNIKENNVDNINDDTDIQKDLCIPIAVNDFDIEIIMQDICQAFSDKSCKLYDTLYTSHIFKPTYKKWLPEKKLFNSTIELIKIIKYLLYKYSQEYQISKQYMVDLDLDIFCVFFRENKKQPLSTALFTISNSAALGDRNSIKEIIEKAFSIIYDQDLTTIESCISHFLTDNELGLLQKYENFINEQTLPSYISTICFDVFNMLKKYSKDSIDYDFPNYFSTYARLDISDFVNIENMCKITDTSTETLQ